MRIRIPITRAIIDRAVAAQRKGPPFYNGVTDCLMAQALRSHFKRPVGVGIYEWSFLDEPGVNYPFSKRVSALVWRYMAGKPITPCTVTIEVPNK